MAGDGNVKSKIVPVRIIKAYGDWKNSSTHS
jgi:hypothetical protein